MPHWTPFETIREPLLTADTNHSKQPAQTMKKRYFAILLGLLIAAAATYLWFNNPLGLLIKTGIEKFGPAMTQAQVHVGRVSLSPSNGRGTLSGLVLGNPRGFKTEHALKAGHIEVIIEPSTLVDNVVLVHKILIDTPDISYEKGDNGSNFDAIQHNVEQYLGTNQGKKSESSAGRKMIIESLVIRNAKVNYNGMLQLSLPDIELHNIGKRSGGATSAQVVAAIVAKLNSELAIALAKSAAIGAVGGVAIGVGMGIKSLLGK